MERNRKFAVEKIRAIVYWLDYQAEGFNLKFQSISDIEKAYDYCTNSSRAEFLDYDYMRYMKDEDLEEHNKIVKEVTELLGYNIFN